jgi:uncharacterized ferritin-like protein (DUF455 family)
MPDNAFIDELDRFREDFLRRLDAIRGDDGVPTQDEVNRRLRLALRQELEAAQIAALWIPSSKALDVKLSWIKLCGDEGKHYRLIETRMQQLGIEPMTDDPLAGGTSKLYDYLATLHDEVERIAAAQYTREAIGHLRNEQFIDFCERAGDKSTAGLYRKQIQPDEWAHVQSGRSLLLKYAADETSRQAARRVAQKTLEIAEGAVQMLVTQQGMSCSPGC